MAKGKVKVEVGVSYVITKSNSNVCSDSVEDPFKTSVLRKSQFNTFLML